MAEKSSAPDSSSNVSYQQSSGSILGRGNRVLKQVNHHLFVLLMGRKAGYTYRQEKGFAAVFLAVAAECTVVR